MGKLVKLGMNSIYVPILIGGYLRALDEWYTRYHQDDVHLHIDFVPYTDGLLITGNGSHNMRRMASQIGSILSQERYKESLKRREKI